jgi:pyruvate/oxaloacetate carboxyltransferase
VREDMGFPPLVTPTSQIVGTQAVVNVSWASATRSSPRRSRTIAVASTGVRPRQINPDLIKKAIGDEEPITGRPADMLEPGWRKAKEEIGDLAESDEDVMSYALFPPGARVL